MLKLVIKANKKTSEFIFNELSKSSGLMQMLFQETFEKIDTIGYSYKFNLSKRDYSKPEIVGMPSRGSYLLSAYNAVTL